MICEIRKFGSEALRRKSVAVKTVTPAVRSLADGMLATMRASNGVGLAAQQIGRREAMLVIDVTGAERDGVPAVRENPGVAMPLVMINPVIKSAEGEQEGQEGCLSFPEMFVTIRRALRITASYVDLEGRRREVSVQGLLSRAIQHEIDHLNGVLLVDRMSPVQRLSLAGRLKRLKQEGAEQDRAA
jgi:peptide deformylase